MAEENIFDIWNIFVNEVIGDQWLAIAIGIILLNVYGIKMKAPFQLIILLDGLLLLAFFTVSQLLAIYVFIGLAVAFLFYLAVSKRIQ